MPSVWVEKGRGIVLTISGLLSVCMHVHVNMERNICVCVCMSVYPCWEARFGVWGLGLLMQSASASASTRALSSPSACMLTSTLSTSRLAKRKIINLRVSYSVSYSVSQLVNLRPLATTSLIQVQYSQRERACKEGLGFRVEGLGFRFRV